MDAKWEKLDNTLSDLWNFFIPPILNAIIILAVIPSTPILLWDWMKSTAVNLQDRSKSVLNSDVAIKINNKVETWFNDADAITKLTDSALSMLVATLILLAIFVFILNKFVLFFSTIIFGKIDLKDESLAAHPQIGRYLKIAEGYLPKDDIFNSFAQKWDYMRTINDLQDNMHIYKGRRDLIASAVENYRVYACYSIAYVAMSALALLRSWPLPQFVLQALITIVSVSMFLFFARRYRDVCVKLADLDVLTFISISKKLNRDAVEVSSVKLGSELSAPGISDNVSFFKGHIGTNVWFAAVGFYSFVSRRSIKSFNLSEIAGIIIPLLIIIMAAIIATSSNAFVIDLFCILVSAIAAYFYLFYEKDAVFGAVVYNRVFIFLAITIACYFATMKLQ